MTTLKRIFAKPIDRAIEGVIKADDDASLRLEVEEYVLTNEVEKRLESFLDAYNNYEGANGVWVSGFFGSGKSHLLKMLALLLENREIDGAKTLDLFLPKCGDNEILRAEINRAVTIPSKSVLFNIDQKADVISKTQFDALLAVFVKVFDEMGGFYGKQGHIAQFERDLDGRGLYAGFKQAYEKIAGRAWETGREQALLESKNIANAYAEVTGGDATDATGILDKYRSEYRVSIEDFAEKVQAYLDQQSKDFRLNFYVDEVGQYIADNVKLMTNLQTIAESLATKCRGRAWVMVTAQEDMNNVVGEMTRQQGNDFSKIQARFANRMKLTSADVAEVIQKRLLAKNEAGVGQLSDTYHAEVNNFKTLFCFADGSQTYRNFQDRDHFIHSYPFIPYQFPLFQAAIQNLSQHSAFEGRHSSVGERSMLGVFQQVAVQIGDRPVGQLATFDLMFEGIRTVVKANIQRAILQAEHHLDDAFAIRVLKALFLVKYVKEFKPTIRNLCVLMLEDMDADLPKLAKRVEGALNLLEQQTYIQRNGEFYEYLTDEEKDIEQEIKNTEVETTDVADELQKLIFDQVLRAKKIRFDKNGQDYAYSRKLDDRLHGREQELAIHIVSPFHEHADNEQMLRTNSTYKQDELFVVLPQEDRLMRDILMFKKTEKYIQQNVSATQQESIKRILTDKGFQNRDRYNQLKDLVGSLLGKAKLLVAGGDVEIGSEDPESRINRGFQELIGRAYPNLRMLRGITVTEADVGNYLRHAKDGLFGGDATSLAESEQELLAFIQSNSRGGVRTTLKSLIEKFERKPYGWYYAAILCNLANLCARGKLEVRVDGNLLEDDTLERALLNTHGTNNVVLEPTVEFTAAQVRRLKEFFGDFFDAPPSSNEAKALGKETNAKVQDLMTALDRLHTQADRYPFLNGLEPVLAKLKDLASKPYTWYLAEISREEDALLDMKEQLIDPVRKFMGGSQKAIYDEAKTFLKDQDANFAYVDTPELDEVRSTLYDPQCFKGNRIQQLKAKLDALKQRVDEQVSEARTKAQTVLDDLQQRLHNMAEYQKLPAERTEELNEPFKELKEHLAQQKLIAVINDRLRYFEEQGYQKLLDRMFDLLTPKPDPEKDTGGGKSAGVREPRPKYVAARQLRVPFDKPLLTTAQDIDQYLEQLRTVLLEQINSGKRVQI
ncbi:MAG: BREX system P-loop protein BrxC [Halochromatium sp.]|nr:BREX system P-loop protein BrxC [Halochromatium sp.]